MDTVKKAEKEKYSKIKQFCYEHRTRLGAITYSETRNKAMKPLVNPLKLELLEDEFMIGPENGLHHCHNDINIDWQNCKHVRPLYVSA